MERDNPVGAAPATQREAAASGSQRPATEIERMARETFGSDEKAQQWLGRPTTALSGLSPLDVSRSGASGMRRVIDLLKRIDHGLSV